MQRVVIVHCWDADPAYAWYPYAKSRLKRLGFDVKIPYFLDLPFPDLDKRLDLLGKTIGQPDEDLYLVGHSIGAITILRYIESLGYNQKIGGAVLVAGFADNLGYTVLNSFFKQPVNYELIKKHCKNFVVINSDNDPYVSLRRVTDMENQLGAEKIIVHSAGHFTPETSEGYKIFPELVHILDKLKLKLKVAT